MTMSDAALAAQRIPQKHRQNPSGIFGYVSAAVGVRNGGLQDDVLDPQRQGVTRDDDAIFGRNNRLQTTNGATLNDQFSRGVTRDRAAERTFPYECKRDGRRFLMATALSEHLLEMYGERLHPSLIRPAKARGIAEDLSDDE
jgi:hypothetical protein